MSTEIEHPGEVDVEQLARRARGAAWQLAAISTDLKNRALAGVSESLERRREEILQANREDKRDAADLVEAGAMTAALAKRLDLEGAKFDTVLEGLQDVRNLPDPVGQVSLARRLDKGLDLYRITCPIGVIGVIFESRPEAAVQIASLALKSSNAVILKGGREALRSNQALISAFREGLEQVDGVPVDAVQLALTRQDVRGLLDLDEWIDLIIPRGSNELVRTIQESTRIPVLGHADGICSVYVDRAADRKKAVTVVVDSKTQYPAVCNAAETLLVHEEILTTLLPEIGNALVEAGVELRADEPSRSHLPGVRTATDADFESEFLDLVMAVKTVRSVEEAVEHINRHGSHHTDAIVTEDPEVAEYFLSRVDSAGVFHNASTRFADGFRYGLGAEVGVSTCKTHARGPVGLDGLVIYKYRLHGSGQGVAPYGPGKKRFLHLPIDSSTLPGHPPG